jgi:hypothetical protein
MISSSIQLPKTMIFSLKQILKSGIYVLPFALLTFANCADPRQLANQVCDCVTNANGNIVKLAKCYNQSEQLKEQLYTKEDKAKFDKAVLNCLGSGVLQKMFQNTELKNFFDDHLNK